MAAESADVELIVLDPHFVDDPWRPRRPLGNLKADSRTAAIPVLVVGPLDTSASLWQSSLESFPDVQFVVTPTETSALPAADRPGHRVDGRFGRFTRAAERSITPSELAICSPRLAGAREARSSRTWARRRAGLALALNGSDRSRRGRRRPGDVPGAPTPSEVWPTRLSTRRDPLPSRIAAAGKPGPPHPTVRPQARRPTRNESLSPSSEPRAIPRSGHPGRRRRGAQAGPRRLRLTPIPTYRPSTP